MGITYIIKNAPKTRWFLKSTLFVVPLALGAALYAQRMGGNFHAVVPGELYRSAQPVNGDIAQYYARYGLKSIINLRGEDANAPWYQAEIAESRRLGIVHTDFHMSPNKELTQDEATRLIALLEAAPKPLLIHCQAGADRSGLASALYLAAIARQGEDAAEWQLSLRYGHMPLPFTPAYAMDRTWERLKPWLGFPDS